MEPSPDLGCAVQLLHSLGRDRSLVLLTDFGLAVFGQVFGSLASIETLGATQRFRAAWECPPDSNTPGKHACILKW